MTLSMKTLGEYAQGRDNNLNLIRMVAATGVLVSHAYPISLGTGTREPLWALTGFSLGTLAVFAFFTISGFLIAASYDRSTTRRRFLAARTLRLFPGLIVSILLVALVMGPLVTALPLGAYLTDPQTYTFIVRNITLLSPQYTLPGVFTDQPYPTVEGSIWTLIYEVLCYMGVFILGVAGLLRRRDLMAAIFVLYVIFWFTVPLLDIDMHPRLEALRRLSLPFAFGTALYLWRDKIMMHWGIALGLLALAAVTKGTEADALTVVMALGYLVFWLAYVPGGALRVYNRLGDYSYGIYIYAFPLQGLAVWLFGAQTPLMNMALAFPATLACAVLSWHVVEKPCLDLMRRKPDRPKQGNTATART